MQIFKKAKKDDSLDQRVRALEDMISTLRFEWHSLKCRYDAAIEGLPSVARQELLGLAQSESIRAIAIYQDKEFYTKLVADQTAELRCKKRELERAIKDVDAALAGLKTDNKE